MNNCRLIKGLGENWGTQKLASLSLSSSTNCNSRVASCSSPEAPSMRDLTAVDNSHEPNTFGAPFRQKTNIVEQNSSNLINRSPKQQQRPAQVKELGSLILQTLDGFAFAVHSDGKIMYISETASVLLGLPQIDLTGSSLFDYVNPSDHNDLVEILGLNEMDRHAIQSQLASDTTNQAAAVRYLELGRSFSMQMKCILPRRNAGLIQNGFKTIHCTGYLKVKRCRQPQPLSMLNPGGKLLDETHGQSKPHNSGAKFSNPRSLSRPKQSENRISGHSQEWESYALVAVGHSLLPSASTEIKLNGHTFMFRANLDMKIYFMETLALNLLGHTQTSIVGQSLYQLIHVADLNHLEEAHRMLLNKGQVVSKYLRLMRREVGSFWVQIQAALINNPRSMPKPMHIVGVCSIICENRLDESQLLLSDYSLDGSNDSCTRMSAAFNLLGNPMGTTSKRRQMVKSRSGNDNHQAIVEIDPKPIPGNNRRAMKRRKGKSNPPDKRMRHSAEDEQETKSKVIEKANHGTPDQVEMSSDKRTTTGGNFSQVDLSHNQSISQLRRFSDDNCSIVSSITSASTTSAFSTSNVGQLVVSCPPSSVTSGYYSSTSPLSLSTTVESSSGHYLSARQIPSTIAEESEYISQTETEVSPASWHIQLHEQQSCCTQVTTAVNSDVGQMMYLDPSRYQTNNYWSIKSDNQNTFEQCKLCTDCAHLGGNQYHQPMPRHNYCDLNERQMDVEYHSRGYYY